jgi:Tfp pilus assembly protein PilF
MVDRLLVAVRGQRFGKAGRFDLAEPAFRAAVEADPGNADAIANLGISLANLGRLDEAQRRLAESLALDDSNALAHLSLGVVLDRQGQDALSIVQYRAALAHDADNVQARVYLADAQMRSGLARDAAQSYREALKRLPDSSRIELSLAIAQIRAGSWAEARKVLESALQQHPDNAELANTLARLLCTAPEPGVRDGRRALQMAGALFQATRSADVGQTFAMALAETGSFDQAVLLQKETMIVFEHTGGAARKPLLERNLARYQRHEASREGWAADDPLFQPRSPAAQLAKAAPSSST